MSLGLDCAHNSCIFRYFSANYPPDQRWGLWALRYTARHTRGNWASRYIRIIRYETLAAFRPAGNTHTYRPTDLLAFLLFIYVALRTGAWEFKLPNLFRTIAQDATCYFLVIFTSHIVLELTLIFARVRIIPITLSSASRLLKHLQPSIKLLPAT